MNQFKQLSISGVYIIENFFFEDERGVFVKTFHKEKFKENGILANFQESYYSESVKNVIRGMHFQAPPFMYEKMVYVTAGSILDVILDLRSDSPSFGKSISLQLNAFGNSVYIPNGCAHGFLTLSDRATVVYNVSSMYHREYDKGILWNSFGFEWPVTEPILSSRDLLFPAFGESKRYF